jgi:hypothetical protein
VDEEVFAYSNRFHDSARGSEREERGLVIYHNKFSDTRGWIKDSAAYLDKVSGNLHRRSIAEGLGLPHEGYVIFKDYVTHQEYIRSCREIWEKGMYFELGAYQCHAFLDWHFVDGTEWKTVCDQLNGAGVQSMQDEWQRHFSVVEEVLVELEAPKKKRAVRKPAATTKKVSTTKKAPVKKTTPSTKAAAIKKKPAVKKPAVKKSAPKVKKTVVKSPVKVKKAAPAKAKPEKKIPAKAKPAVASTPKAKKPVVRKPTVARKTK